MHPDDAVDLFDVVLDPLALIGQILVAVGLEQEAEKRVEFFLQFGLIGRGGRETLVLQKLDDRFEASVDVLLAALSAFTVVLCHCHRRDFTSPRRVGRRI